MRKNSFVKILFVFTLSFCFIGGIDAACSSTSHLYSGKAKDCRASGVKSRLSSNASTLKNFTCEYNFRFGLDRNVSVSTTKDSGHALSDTNIKKWLNFKPDYHLVQPAFGAKDSNSSYTGGYSYLYKNVGTYINASTGETTNVDVRETLIGYNLGNTIHLNKCGTGRGKCYKNFIDFYNNKSNTRLSNYIGVMTIGGKWIKVRYDFYKSGTTTPIYVKGYTTYWDVDWDQGVVLNNGAPRSGVTRIFSDSSNLRKATYNGNPYVFDNGCTDSSNENKKYAFTELFEGTSITRTFTFQKTNKCDSKLTASGEIWQDPRAISPICPNIPVRKEENVNVSLTKKKATDVSTKCGTDNIRELEDKTTLFGNKTGLNEYQIMACGLTGKCNNTNTSVTTSGNIETTTVTTTTYNVSYFEKEGTTVCPAYCKYSYSYSNLYDKQDNSPKSVKVYGTRLQIPETDPNYALGTVKIERDCVSTCDTLDNKNITAKVDYANAEPNKPKQLITLIPNPTTTKEKMSVPKTMYTASSFDFYHIKQTYNTKFTNGEPPLCLTDEGNLLPCGSGIAKTEIKGIYKTVNEKKIKKDKDYNVSAQYTIDNKDNFTHTHICTYKVNKSDNSNCYGEEQCSPSLKYRQISLNKIFNKEDKLPLNWLSVFTDAVKKIQNKGEGIFAEEPDYSFKITSSQMKAIKEYNKKYEYNTETNQEFWKQLTTTDKYCKEYRKKE